MPCAIHIRQTGVLSLTSIDVGEPGSGQMRLRSVGARNLGLHHADHRAQYPKEFAVSKTAVYLARTRAAGWPV